MAVHGKIKPPGKRWSKRLQKSKVFGHAHHAKKSIFSDLLITPMVDMFVIIVLFLIANFSATGEVLGMTKDIELPKAAHVQEIEMAEVVMVSMNQVILSGNLIGQVADLIKDESGTIPALEEQLREKKLKWETLHQSAGDTKGFTGDINIQAHREVPFNVIKRVMMSCHAAGFSNINFAVLQVGERDAQTTASAVP